MESVVSEVLKWLLIAIAISPVAFALGYIALEGYIKPAIVPTQEIERLADEIAHQHPEDPEETAYWNEYAAWHRSESFEQGKWRRVRKLLRRTQKA